MKIAWVMFMLCWALLSVALAQGSLNEHSSEISSGLWVVVIALLGLIQALIGYIYITGQKTIKDQQRLMMEMITEMKKSADKRDDILIELHTEHRLMMNKCVDMHLSHRDAED